MTGQRHVLGRSEKRRVSPTWVRRWTAVFALLVTVFFAAAASARTEPEVFSVGETHFEMDAADGMARFVTEARAVVEADWARVQEVSGAPDGQTVQIHIERRFDDYFERNGLPSRPPEWAAGLALPWARVILLAPGNPTWESTLSHEMAHVAVAMAAGDGHVPAWFTEGFAVATAEQWSLERASTMIQAGVTGSFHDFADLDESFPAAQSSAELAYAQSFHFVRYCRNHYGDDVFRRVMERMRTEGLTFYDGFYAETDTLLTVAYDKWEQSARTRFVWTPVATGGGAAWVFMSALSMWAWRRRRKTKNERLAKMQSVESELYAPDPDDELFG